MVAKKPMVGVLSLQGAFSLHRVHLEAAGANYVEVVRDVDLNRCTALILPGGESSSMLKQMRYHSLFEPIVEFSRSRFIWGVCAGAILLARAVKNPSQESLGLIDMEVVRNGYGRQCDSFEAEVHGRRVSFIRAPIIRSVGPNVKIRHQLDGRPTWVEAERIMATTFHPELSYRAPSPWHVELKRRGAIL